VGTDAEACDGDWRLAHFGKLGPNQAKELWADVQRLPPLPRVWEKVGISDRFLYLDMVCNTACGGARFPEIAKGGALGELVAKSVDAGVVDWDRMLRSGNRHFDQVVALGGLAGWQERHQAARVLSEEMSRRVVRARDAKVAPRGKTRENAAEENVAEVLCSAYLCATATPVGALLTAEDAAAIRVRLTEVALALGAYRTEEGRYPEKLRDLQPKYLGGLPKDPYSGGDYCYGPRGDGYILYSVGPNGVDENGPKFEWWGAGDDENLKRSDDVGIRMPGQKGQHEKWGER